MKVNKNSKRPVLKTTQSKDRISIDLSLSSILADKKVSFSTIPPRRSSLQARSLKTEPTPSKSFSITDFWKLQPSPTLHNLTFTKIDIEQETMKRYLSKVLINYQTNILQAFRRIRNPSQISLKIKSVNKHNKWYKRAANIVAMNSRINQQKCLWRLVGVKEIVQKVSYVKYIDMVIYPQQYVNYQPFYKAILRLENMYKDNEIKKVIKTFHKNQREKRIKENYMKKVDRNYTYKCKEGFNKLRNLPNNKKTQKFYKIKDKFRAFLSQYINSRIRMTYLAIKDNRNEAKLKKSIILHRKLKNTYRNADKAFFKWLMYMKQKRQSLKRQKLTLMFQIIYDKQQSFDPNLSKKIQQTIQRLMDIQQFYRKQHLLRTFKLWKGKQNPWYKRAARIMSINTVLNSQTSLWRLKQFPR